MNDTNNKPIKPKIDDQYWFDLSENLIKDAASKRDKAAEKLQNLAIWLWGIYTASAAVGFTLSGKALSLWPTILIASASAGLISVYWGAMWIQMPTFSPVAFDPRAPDQIKNAYNNIIKTKNRRLRITFGLSIIAVVMVSLALIVASLPQKQTELPDFNATIVDVDSQTTLALTGSIPDTEEVTIIIQPIEKEKVPAAQRKIFKLLDQGLLQVSIPLETDVKEVKVSIEWMTPKIMSFCLSKVVRKAIPQKTATQ